MLKLYVGVKEYKSSLPSFEFHHSQLAIYLFHFLYKIIKKKKNENTWHTYHDWWKKKSGTQKVIQNIFIRFQIISINNFIMH